MTGLALSTETPAHVLALAGYAAATFLAWLGIGLRRPALVRAARVVALVALAVHSAALGLRWVGTGHGPYLTRYEVLSSNAWATMALWTALSARRGRGESGTGAGDALTVLVYPAALLLLGIGVYTGNEVRMLPPTFTGVWLVLHVGFYFVAFASALMATASSVMLLWSGAPPLARALERSGADVPAPDVLDHDSYRYAGLTFAFWGIGMLTGSIWAYHSWGRYWGWDPMETWSLVTWFVYGIHLHLRRSWGLKGRAAAAMLVACFAVAVVALFFTSIIGASLHSEYFS